MQKITITNIQSLSYFEIPYEWIDKKGLSPNLSDLESSAERGVLTGELFRSRIAELPSTTLKFLTDRTQKELHPLLKIIRPIKVWVLYFDSYENMFVQREFYIVKPTLTYKTIPNTSNTDDIIYDGFDLKFIGYKGAQ